MADSFLVGESLLGQIRSTIKRVDGMPDGSGVTKLSPRIESPASRQPQKVLRVGTITGSWSKNVIQTVTPKFGSTVTLSANNLLYDLDASDQSARTVIVGKDGTAWYFVAAGNKPPCESMAGKEISPVGYSNSLKTDDINPAGSGPAALFLASGCVEWVRTDKITYVSNVEVNGGMITVHKSAAWAFTPAGTASTVTSSYIGNTVSQTVITRLTLEPEKLVAERAEVLVLGVTQLTSSEIQVYECATATGSTT